MKYIALVLMLFTLTGCDVYTSIDFKSLQHQTQSAPIYVNSDIILGAKVASKNIPDADKVLLFKMCQGFVAFLQNGNSTSTLTAFNQLDKVQKLYGWPDNKYSDWNDFVAATLGNKKFTNGVDYSLPQNLGTVKDNLILIFNSFSEGLK